MVFGQEVNVGLVPGVGGVFELQEQDRQERVLWRMESHIFLYDNLRSLVRPSHFKGNQL